jgi:hypothetical protein
VIVIDIQTAEVADMSNYARSVRMNYPIPKRLNYPITQPKQNKYKNTKIEIDNIKFDSIKEAKRYRELKLMEQAGEIKDLQMQVPYILQDSFKLGNKTYREIKYIADFTYMQKNKTSDIELWELVIEDTKGYKTKEYLLKRKMFAYKYQIEISEV